jgi:hypothetical protein
MIVVRSESFVADIIERVAHTYEPDEVVLGMELSIEDIAEAFEKDFLAWAFNEGFFAESQTDDEYGAYNE